MKVNENQLMNYGSTIFLRLALVAIGTIGLIMCGLLISGVYREWPREFPDMEHVRYPAVAGIAIAGAAFTFALYQAFRLLDLIDKNKSFSSRSVKTLQKIKYAAFVIAGVFTAGMPVVFSIAEKDDAPGLILIAGAIFIGIPVVVAVFAGVCQRLFQNAIDLKSENDLTV